MNHLANLAREVVAQRIAIIAAVVAVLHLAVALNWVQQDWSDSAVKTVTGGLDLLGTIAATLVARRAVTPNKDPRTKDGTPLVPAPAGAHAAADAAPAP